MLVAYLRVRGYRFHHSANETTGGSAGRWQGIRNKRNGTSPGFPDFLIIIGDQLVAVELKRQRGSHTSPEQLEWIEALNDCGVPAKVCNGADAAIEFVETWAESVALRRAA